MTVRPQAIIGYQPDLSPDTPGVIAYSDQVLPTDRGIGNGWGLTEITDGFSVSTLPLGGFESTNIAGVTRVFAGTNTKLYERIASVALDVSGSVYNATDWTFAQYGNNCLAINKNDRLQASTAGSFANAFADAPKATVVIVAGPATRPFAILFDYDDGTDTPHGIYWNPDPTLTWATSIATQVGNVSVVDINGKFTAAVPYRDGAIAFKANAMYQGRYVGGADMWVWDRISSDVGCLGPHAVCLANDVVYFADANGLWEFDGSYPRPMHGAIHQWFANNHEAAEVRFTWDKSKHVLWVRYAVTFSRSLFLAFNPRSQLWTQYGYLNNGINIAYLLLGPNYAVDAILPSRFCSIAKSPANTGTVRLSAIGAEYGMVHINSVRPHWLQGPSDTLGAWTSCSLYYGATLRNVTDNILAMDFAIPGRFDKAKVARFVQPQLTVEAVTWEIDSVATDGKVAGQE